MEITLPDGTHTHIRITANPIAGRPATRQDLLYALDRDPPEDPTAILPLTGSGFAIVCLQCGNTHVQQWDRSRGGEYEGKLFKCGDCEQEQLQ